MKTGDTLTAINECKMHDDGRSTLTIGKEYMVEDICTNDFAVMDDEGDYHWFPIYGFDIYFTKNQ
jgi:hypothetical protein